MFCFDGSVCKGWPSIRSVRFFSFIEKPRLTQVKCAILFSSQGGCFWIYALSHQFALFIANLTETCHQKWQNVRIPHFDDWKLALMEENTDVWCGYCAINVIPQSRHRLGITFITFTIWVFDCFKQSKRYRKAGRTTEFEQFGRKKFENCVDM